MTRTLLKRWMTQHNKTIIDVASLTLTHPNTVRNYLNGKKIHRRTIATFERLVMKAQADLRAEIPMTA